MNEGECVLRVCNTSLTTPHCPCLLLPRMTTLPPFQLDVAPPISEVLTWAGLSLLLPPTVLCLGDDLATSQRPGSFNHDCNSGLYPHEWGNLAKFERKRDPTNPFKRSRSRSRESSKSLQSSSLSPSQERKWRRLRVCGFPCCTWK